MRMIANILWHIPFLGFLNAFAVFLLGGLLVLTVVGSPIGLGLIQYSKFLLGPFSRKMVSKTSAGKKENIIWKSFGLLVWIIYLPFGLLLVFFTSIQILFLFITIIGIPNAIILAKSLGTYFNPVGKICVRV